MGTMGTLTDTMMVATIIGSRTLFCPNFIESVESSSLASSIIVCNDNKKGDTCRE